MSRESGSEHGQRTVADLLAQYGGSGDGPRRRRRRAEDDQDSAPKTIIQRVLSDSGQLMPIRDEAGGHRSGDRRAIAPNSPNQQPNQQQQSSQQPGPPGTPPGQRPMTARSAAPPAPQPPAPQTQPPPPPTSQPPTSQPGRPADNQTPGGRAGGAGGGDQGGTTYARPVSPPGAGQPGPQSPQTKPPQPLPPASPGQSPGPSGANPPSRSALPSVGTGSGSWPVTGGGGGRPAPPGGQSRGALPPVNPVNPPSRPLLPQPGRPPGPNPVSAAATEVQPQITDGFPDQEYPDAEYPGEDADNYPGPGGPGPSPGGPSPGGPGPGAGGGRRPDSPIAAAFGQNRPEPLTQELPSMPVDAPPNRPLLRGRPLAPRAGGPPSAPAESTQAHAGPYVDDDRDADYPAGFPGSFPDHDVDARSAGPGDIGRRLAGEEPAEDEADGFFGHPENRLDESDENEHDGFDDPDAAAEDDEDEPEQSSARQWLTMIVQVGVGAIAGAAVFLGFSWLWGKLPGAALAAALLVIVGLVLVVRRLRHAEDLQTTLLAILAGLVVTVSPAALLLLRR